MSISHNSSFDPYTQNITILMADGITPVVLSMQYVDSFFYYNMASCINYGAQLGACLLMFFVVAILTKHSQRSTPVYFLNLLSLLLGFLRSLLLSLYFVSPWNETYAALAMDFSRVPRYAYATSIAGDVMPLLMTVTVNLSLVIQAYTVCKTMGDMYRHIISGVSCIVVLLAIGFRFSEVVVNSIAALSAKSFYDQTWIQVGTLATETISIWFFSIVFTAKLMWTLYIRKRNGWKQWSAVRILAAMGGCTMVIPSIFAILEYVTPRTFPEAGTLALTMVALLLPLSSLWARMATDSEGSTLNLSHLSGGSKASQLPSDSQRKMFSSQSTGPRSNIELLNERKGSLAAISPTTVDSMIECTPSGAATKDSTEMDLVAMGVRVDRSYTVHSGKRVGGFGMD